MINSMKNKREKNYFSNVKHQHVYFAGGKYIAVQDNYVNDVNIYFFKEFKSLKKLKHATCRY